jgi:hypothetical protein
LYSSYNPCTFCKIELITSVKIEVTVSSVSGSVYEILIYSDVTLCGFGLYISPSIVSLIPLNRWSIKSSLAYLSVRFVGVVEHLQDFAGIIRCRCSKQQSLFLIVFFICYIIL